MLGASEQPTEFSLTNTAGTHSTGEGISSPVQGELVFSSFQSLWPEPYFWSLPSRFRGDKVGREQGFGNNRSEAGRGVGAEVWGLGQWETAYSLSTAPAVFQVTSYGGELHFTVTQRPQRGSAPLPKQPLVVLQGNGIVLEHRTSEEPIPGQPSTFAVPFREVSSMPGAKNPLWRAGWRSPPLLCRVMALWVLFLQQAWQRPDGQPATREHLLMALAGIDSLLIQASFTQKPAETRCWDTADEGG